jgi:hypothetical protein
MPRKRYSARQVRRRLHSAVRQRFADFLAAWQQKPENEKIPPKVSTLIYHVHITSHLRILLLCLNLLSPLLVNFGNCATRAHVAYRETRATRAALPHQIAFRFFRDLSQLLWRTTVIQIHPWSQNTSPVGGSEAAS